MTLEKVKAIISSVHPNVIGFIPGAQFLGSGCSRFAYGLGPWAVKQQAKWGAKHVGELTPAKLRAMQAFGVQPCPTETVGEWEIQPRLREMNVGEKAFMLSMISLYVDNRFSVAILGWDCHCGNIMVDPETGIFYAVDW